MTIKNAPRVTAGASDMTSHVITADMETIKIIAQASAEAAAKQVSQELREDVREQFGQLEDRMAQRLRNYFGQLDASKHVVQHDRLERMLAAIDRMSENVFTNLMGKLMWGLLIAGLFGYVMWTKLTGGVV